MKKSKTKASPKAERQALAERLGRERIAAEWKRMKPKSREDWVKAHAKADLWRIKHNRRLWAVENMAVVVATLAEECKAPAELIKPIQEAAERLNEEAKVLRFYSCGMTDEIARRFECVLTGDPIEGGEAVTG